MSKKVNLKIKDIEIDLDLIEGSENELAIDISKLRANSNLPSTY